MNKVPVVEDVECLAFIIKQGLEGRVLVIQAFTIKEAEAAFKEHPDLAAILMDACVPGDKPNTMRLVEEMRKTFTGPIIAISSVADYRKELMEVGCDYEAEKTEAAQKVLGLVGAS